MDKRTADKLRETAIASTTGNLFTPERLRIEFSDQDYRQILKYVKSYAKDVNVDDIVLFCSSTSGTEGFKTGAVFTEKYMYGPHTPPIYLYGMEEVSREQDKSHTERTFTVTYGSRKVTGKVKGIFGYVIIDCLQLLVGQKEGTLTYYDMRQMALESIREGKNEEAETLLVAICDKDGEAAGMLARHHYETDPVRSSYYTGLAKKQGHFLGYYMEGVYAINNSKDLKKGYEMFLEAYERGMGGIQNDMLGIRNALLESRSAVKREKYAYGSLDADPNMFGLVKEEAYHKEQVRFLAENNDKKMENTAWGVENRSRMFYRETAGTDFADYMREVLSKNSGFSIHYYTEEEKRKEYFKQFRYFSNVIDRAIMDYCRLHKKFDVTQLPPLGLKYDYDLAQMGIQGMLDMKSYAYEHSFEYSEYDVFFHLKSAAGLNLIRRLKDQKVAFSKKDNIEFIEHIILCYETVMAEYKKLVAPALAILGMWNTDTERGKHDPERMSAYLAGARQAVLGMDERFLELKEKFCKKAKISDSDLFKGDQASYERIIRREKVKFIGGKLNLQKKWYTLLTFEPYQYSYDEYYSIKRSFVKKYDKKFDVNKALFCYDRSMTDLECVITDEYFYATCFPEPISLKGLVCCKTTEDKQLVLLYDNLKETVITYSSTYELRKMRGILWFLNRILLHL